MRPEFVIYTAIAVPVSLPVLTAAVALQRRRQVFPPAQDGLSRRELLGLQLFLLQTLLPVLQFIVALNIHATDSPLNLVRRIGIALFLPVAPILFALSFGLLVCFCRGARRIFLPLVSLFTLVVSALLFLTLFATA